MNRVDPQPAPVQIRIAGLDDARLLSEAAARMFRDAFGEDTAPDDMDAYVAEAFSVEQISAELGDDTNVFLLATREGGPVGYAKLRAGSPDPSVSGEKPVELHRLYVDQATIGAGVGSILMKRCFEWSKGEGYRTIWLGVWEHNHRAIRFYERWGFKVVGSHPFVIGETEDTDLIMERPLD